MARLEAAGGDIADDAQWIAGLERRGVVRGPSGELPEGWASERPKAKGSAVAAVLAERDEDR